MGLYMWVFPPNVFELKIADMSLLFEVGPFIFMFLIPAITMRTFAEERKQGTLELLLTRPLTEWNLIMGKFLACFALVVIALLPTLVYYFSIYFLGNPVGNLDTAGIMGSYVGLLMLGAVYTSIGVFCSSFTENQIIAFISAFFLSLLLYVGFGYLSEMFSDSSYAYRVEQLGLSYHYGALSRGVLDSRNVLFLMSELVLILAATKVVLNARKW